MKVLITGSSGFIGGYLKKGLDQSKHEWISFDLNEGNDVCNKEHFNSLDKNIDVVIHLASKTFVPDSYTQPYPFFNVNAQGILNVLEYCRLNRAKLVYISSYVYGSPQYTPIDENHPVDAFNPYSGSKLIAENLCHYYHKFWNLPIIILRPFNIYGFGQSSSFLISQIIEQAIAGHIKVKETSPRRDYIHVTDVVNAIIKSIEYESKTLNTFNLGTGISHSVQEAIELTCTHFENVKVSSENESRKNEVTDTIADISKIKNLLGWQPNIAFADGIEQMVTEYLSKQEKKNGKFIAKGSKRINC